MIVIEPPTVDDPEAAIEALKTVGAYGVQFKSGDHTHLILSRKRDATGPLSGGGLETDGEVAAVETGDDGRLLHAMAIGARRLCYNGVTQLDEDTPRDRAMRVKPEL